MRRTLARRLANVEIMVAPRAPDTGAVFIESIDGSSPDRRRREPELGWRPPLGPVTAARASGPGQERVERRPGESIEALKRRAAKQLPDTRVFVFEYALGQC